MPRTFKLASLAILATIACGGSAFAENKEYDNPKYKGAALDWCKAWATDCGQPAADAWCVTKGYENASKFSKWNDIGEPTRIISSGQLCDQSDCDSFEKIVCQKADMEDDGGSESEQVTYSKPMAGGRRLDWCLTWATDCGKPAADYYCKSKGHDGATAFKISSDIGKTRLLKTGEKCTQPDCDGFKFITCE